MPENLTYDYSDDIPMQPGESDVDPTWGRIKHGIHDVHQPFSGAGFTGIRTRAGANTLIKGGWDTNATSKFNDMGWVKRQWYEDYNPKSWFRAPTQNVFNIGNTHPANMLFFKDAHGDASGAQKLTRLGSWIRDNETAEKLGLVTKKGDQRVLEHIWDPKLMSRMSASGKYTKMGTLSGEQTGNLFNYLEQAGGHDIATTLSSATGGLGPAMFPEMTGDLASQAVWASTRGVISGRIAGWTAGAAGKEIDPLITKAASPAFSGAYEAGQTLRNSTLNAAGEKMGFQELLETNISRKAAGYAGEMGLKETAPEVVKTIGSLVARTGAEIGLAAGEGFINPVMDILAVYGAVKLAVGVGELAWGAGVGLGESAIKSFRGQIGKSPFGMGYKDSAAAATSRARGVSAIANSRLNARSVLGNEAGMMAAHFG